MHVILRMLNNIQVIVRSHSLDERFLYSQAEVRQVHWHPSSLSHVLVLVSDNTIRLYNIAIKTGPKLVKIISIGLKPSSCLAGRTILDSLGDTAVDFTPRPDSDDVLILRGNGDVYMMQCELDSKSGLQPKLCGPLAMFPAADDNYGSDSCSIACLPHAHAPLVLLATCGAHHYHCLLLPSTSDKDGADTHALYVVESVELNVSLRADDVDMQYSYPVLLLPCGRGTYACAHAGGAHAVAVPLLAALHDYVRAGEDEWEHILSTMSTCRSSARHVVATGAGADAGAGGVGMAVRGGLLHILCKDGTLLIRALDPFDIEEELFKEIQLKNRTLEQDDINNILKERQKLSFSKIMQELLTRDVSQPILNLSKSEEPSPKECLEFLTQATLKLRTEYMSRQDRASEATARKLVSLKTINKQHDQWYNELKKEIEQLKSNSDTLRERCELAEKIQDDLKYRCSSVMRGVRAHAPASGRERELLQQLQAHARRARQHTHTVAAARSCREQRAMQMKQWQEEYKKKDVALGKSHSDTIKSIVEQQTSQISQLIEETKLLKDQLNIF